jgi:mRNA interferase HigB
MRVISFAMLRDFAERGHADAAVPLREWFKTAEHAQWNTMADVRRDFPSADLVGGDRLVFNIGGNKYRLVSLVHFGRPTLFLLWVGTHAEYDRINVKEL